MRSMEADSTVCGNSDSDLPHSCKLFIGGLSYDTTDASLSRYFEKYGQVASAVVMRDANTLRSRGFGFVTFCTLKAANDVVNYPRHNVDGRKVEAKFAVPRSGVMKGSSAGNGSASLSPSNKIRKNSSAGLTKQNGGSGGYTNGARDGDAAHSHKGSKNRKRSDSKMSSVAKGNRHRGSSLSSTSSGEKKCGGIVPNKVFVGGLLYATGHESLRNYFEQFGPVETAEVIYNRDTKKSRGFGFVVFQTFDAVRNALHEQHTNRLVVDGKQVEVKICMARHDSMSPSISKTIEELDLGRHRSDPSKTAEMHSKPNIPQPSIIAPVENQWHSRPLAASFAHALGSQGDALSVESPRQEVSYSVGSLRYDEPKEDLQDSFSRGRASTVTGELFSIEPLLDSSDLLRYSRAADSYKPTLSSPLTTPLSSPFTNGFTADENEATSRRHSNSLFINYGKEDTWVTPEQKGVTDDFNTPYDLTTSFQSLDIRNDSGNESSSAFSKYCASPISTSSNPTGLGIGADPGESFGSHDELFSPLNASGKTQYSSSFDYSMFSFK